MKINKTILIVGSEGLIGQAFQKRKLEQRYDVICIDIKKKERINYYFCDLKKIKNFKKILKKIAKKMNYLPQLILCIQSNTQIFYKTATKNFLNFINSHLISYYNFNSEFFKLFSKSKKKNID